ncbi:MAG: 30S ribosomal protein S15 [Alphaproteobacteria bacterium]|nr:MAG: 30S ribosomal protein S15 [Alphaproteobacteria bacterium]
MSITKEQRQETIKKFARKEGDTGSPEVQVALLTNTIKNITEHLKKNKNDTHTRVGLMRQVNQRKRLLSYLKRVDADRYKSLIDALDIRK